MRRGEGNGRDEVSSAEGCYAVSVAKSISGVAAEETRTGSLSFFSLS